MVGSPEKFAQLLSQAVRRIALNRDTKIQVVQDELGYALGREAGGSSIEYWRKGHIPANLAELEQLARELIRQGGLAGSAELEQFLAYADHPDPVGLSRQLSAGLPLPAAETGLNPEMTELDLLSLAEHPPFVAGPPISHPRYFFGREREIKRLFNLLKHRPLQNAAIIGPRRSGKTSLLHYLKNVALTPAHLLRADQHADWLPNPAQYRWILVDFQDTRLGSQEGLLRYLLTRLKLPLPEPCRLDRFLDVVSSHGLRQPTVILFDEIGVALERYAELDNSFWEGLRALATNQVGGNLAFILAAHEAPEQLARHSDLGSPFFNIFGYTAFLGPFSESEARALIAASPTPFPPEDVDWLLAESGRWPLLLQILCRERLFTLENDETDPNWRAEALRQLAPFRYLLDSESTL
jgi:hypothetical protein